MIETVLLVFEDATVGLVDVARRTQLPYGLSDSRAVVSVKGSGHVCHIVEILDYAVDRILDDPKLAEVCVKRWRFSASTTGPRAGCQGGQGSFGMASMSSGHQLWRSDCR